MTSAATPPQAWVISCAPNLRDLGGMTAEGGRIIRPGTLYRSEFLAPHGDDAATLAAAGIRNVLDLRSARERGTAPNTWFAAQGATIHEVDITADFRAGTNQLSPLLDHPDETGATALMRATYREMPHGALSAFGTAAELLIGGKVPLLIHCTAGKDRTGFICAMLLLIAGVLRDAVMADYLASEGRRHPDVTAATARVIEGAGIVVTDGMLRALNGVSPDYLDAALAVVDAEFGGTAAYANRAGVNALLLRDALTI